MIFTVEVKNMAVLFFLCFFCFSYSSRLLCLSYFSEQSLTHSKTGEHKFIDILNTAAIINRVKHENCGLKMNVCPF